MFSIEKLYKFAFTDESSFLTLREALTNDLAISNPYYLMLARFYSEFYLEYKHFPKDGDIQVWLSDHNDNQRTALKSALSHINGQDVANYTKEYVLNEAIDSLREVATKNAIKRLDSTQTSSPEELERMLESINRIKSTNLEGIISIRDTHLWLPIDDDIEIKWKTGIQKLDSYIGGFANELVFLLAGTGVGKTTGLMNIAKAVAFQGGKVLHITLELFAKPSAHRYYRRIAEADRDEFLHSYDNVKGLVDHWFSWHEGEIHVIYRPAYTVSVDDIKTITRQYAEEYGSPDFIIIDYLDLLSDGGYGKMQGWERLGRQSHEIRSLCDEYDCAVASAAQANREGMDATELKAKHFAGAISKLQAADLAFGLMQDVDELELNQGRMVILKARENPGRGAEIPLYINMDKMMILDLDHPDSQRLIRQQTKEMENVLNQQVYA